MQLFLKDVFCWRPSSREKHCVALSLRCFNRCCLSVPFVKGGAVENGLKNSPEWGEGWILCSLPLLTCLVPELRSVTYMTDIWFEWSDLCNKFYILLLCLVQVLLVDLRPINWSPRKYMYVFTTLSEVKGALLQGPSQLTNTGKTLNLTLLWDSWLMWWVWLRRGRILKYVWMSSVYFHFTVLWWVMCKPLCTCQSSQFGRNGLH